jgi:hypothetical protein
MRRILCSCRLIVRHAFLKWLPFCPVVRVHIFRKAQKKIINDENIFLEYCSADLHLLDLIQYRFSSGGTYKSIYKFGACENCGWKRMETLCVVCTCWNCRSVLVLNCLQTQWDVSTRPLYTYVEIKLISVRVEVASNVHPTPASNEELRVAQETQATIWRNQCEICLHNVNN